MATELKVRLRTGVLAFWGSEKGFSLQRRSNPRTIYEAMLSLGLGRFNDAWIIRWNYVDYPR